MSYQDLLDQTIVEPKPPPFDVDTLIDRERRRHTRRRLGTSLGAVAGTVAVVVGITTVLSTGGRTEPAPASARPPHDRFSYTIPADQRAFDAEVSARLTPVLQKSVQTMLPTATLQGPAGEAPLLVRGRLTDLDPPEPRPFDAGADVRTADGTGHVTFQIGLDVPAWSEIRSDRVRGMSSVAVSPGFSYLKDCAAVASTEDAGLGAYLRSDCRESVGPHDERIVSFQLAGNGIVRAYELHAIKPDGTILLASSGNWAIRFDKTKPFPEMTPGPPLSREQLIQIATEPALTFWA